VLVLDGWMCSVVHDIILEFICVENYSDGMIVAE